MEVDFLKAERALLDIQRNGLRATLVLEQNETDYLPLLPSSAHYSIP